MSWFGGRHKPQAPTDQQRRTTHMAAALLLDYPGGNFDERLDAVDVELPSLPKDVAHYLSLFITEARAITSAKLAEHYVATFDQRRRATLYLSYYSAGDTRRRGAAILAFKEAQKACGWECEAELPDFLPLVLELSSRTDGTIADGLLNAHREGLEMIQAGLNKVESPYRHVMEAVRATLPEPDSEVRQRVLDLISQGPPSELVGITDFTTPAFPMADHQEVRA